MSTAPLGGWSRGVAALPAGRPPGAPGLERSCQSVPADLDACFVHSMPGTRKKRVVRSVTLLTGL